MALLAACSADKTASQMVGMSTALTTQTAKTDSNSNAISTHILTDTLSPIATYTKTLIPTLRPSITLRSTNTRRPSPTPTLSPTITPTFDAAKIVTVTPAPPAQCPPGNPDLIPDISSWYGGQVITRLEIQPILDFLNSGGTPGSVINAFLQKFNLRIELPGAQEDLTGDSIDEVILTDGDQVLIFGCNESNYQHLLSVSVERVSGLEAIRFILPGDMNLNGIPEIVTNEMRGHWTASHHVVIYEWNGQSFQSVIQGLNYSKDRYVDYAYMPYPSRISFREAHNNGLLEMILEGKMPWSERYDYVVGMPWRKEIHVYTWNGTLFVLDQINYEPPEYRYQAVQDGDRATLTGNYDQAVEFYQQAIFSDQLNWWSERFRYESWQHGANDHTGLEPTPLPDFNEYYNLAAYARYRIMLIHVSRGFITEANTVYNSLLQKFPEGLVGHAYAEMATAFWNEYQTSADLSLSCAKSIEYATLHPVEILSYLGNGEYAITYYGDQSLEYTPEDVCPFR